MTEAGRLGPVLYPLSPGRGRVSLFRATTFSLPCAAPPGSIGESYEPTSMPSPIRIRRRRLGGNPDRGLLDTSVVIGAEEIDASRLPTQIAISALTLAELSAGPHLVLDEGKRADRQELVQRVEAAIEILTFDSECARAYGAVCAATAVAGRKARGSRTVDLMIAATAFSYGVPLYTLNAADLKGLGGLIEIVDLG